MNNFFFSLALFLSSLASFSQTAWTWTELDTMPVRISNNAVAPGFISGQPYVYSLGGIDTSKIFSGITDRAFRYDVTNNTWIEIAPVPRTQPLIASSASMVKNKIYILGGYHVFSNGDETSSNEVIVYDPESDSYLPNGQNIPVPIDDHCQAVWRDSLIYVISGWSNTGNVTNVQIYNPELDSWSVGTPVPNASAYKVFGSAGYILGDTIFYYGGAASGLNFPAQAKLRKGLINAVDPTIITWSQEQDGPENSYRSACLAHGNNIFWVGGSPISYNYNGIAYNGSGGVEPLYQIMRYDAFEQTWYAGTGAPYGVMDLRGVAQVGPTSWIICGGMQTGQQVSNRTFLLEYDPVTGGIEEQENNAFHLTGRQLIFEKNPDLVTVYSADGRVLGILSGSAFFIDETCQGIILVEAFWSNTRSVQKFVLN